MSWEVLERVGLPEFAEREVHPGIKVPVPTGDSVVKEPGDTITQAELDKFKQSPEDIKRLERDKAIRRKS